MTSINSPPTPSLGVGYSTYKSKRSSRTSSGVIPTEQSFADPELHEKLAQQLADSASTIRLNGTTDGYITPTPSSGSPTSNRSVTTPPANGHPAVFITTEPTTPSPSTRAVSPAYDALVFKAVPPLPLGSPLSEPVIADLPTIDEAVSLRGPALVPDGPTRNDPTAPSVVIEVTEAPAKSPLNDAASGQTDPEPEKDLPATPSSSSAGGQASLKPPIRSNGSTFRRIGPRTSTKPTAPSPLRPASSVRSFSGASASSLRPASISSTTSRLQSSVSPSRTFSPANDAAFPRPSSQASSIPLSDPSASGAASRVPSTFVSPMASPGLTSTFPPEGMLDPRTVPRGSVKSSSTVSPSPSNPALPYEIRQSASFSSSISPTPGTSTPARVPTVQTPTPSISGTKPLLAPYRPGFQPKGVYSPRTDEFMALRAKRMDGRQAEEKRLLRRLEKLVDLHFAPETPAVASRTPATRRSSSFLDFSELKSKSAADLWKGVVESASARSDRQIRETEQSITRWEDDKAVSACPICTQSFHPLTNRKHHCRLCGRVVCSLPPRPPQRPQKCSLLIVADHRTGKVEEVPDVIAYGVTRRDSISSPTLKSPGTPVSAKDKDAHLRGVRVCRDCYGVVTRKQFVLESSYVPSYARMHKAMLRVEHQIEDSLPQFQELLINAANGEVQLDRSAMATRKDLLEMFSEYDTVAKRIRAQPTIPGSSQERLQAAIAMRASMFLQQHMLPLKRLANQRHKQGQASSQTSSTASDITSPDPLTPNGPFGADMFRVRDTDASLAHSLQPLLEQEALLESYVDEALQARKFEDAQTLKSNLDEIRSEISRMARDGKLR